MSSALAPFLDQALHSRLIVEDARTCIESARSPDAPGTAIPRFETLMLMLEGDLTIHYEGQVFPVRQGDLFLHPAWGLRRLAYRRKVRVKHAFVTFSTPPNMAMSMPLLRVQSADFAQEKRAMTRLAELARGRPPLWNLLAEADLKVMLARMAEVFLEAGGTNQPSTGSNGTHAAEKALQWIRAHYCRSQVLEEAHRRGPISARYFRQICRERTGLSPQQLVQVLRLRAARFFLLEHKERKIAEVANAVGFEDPLYFSKVYHAHWGCAPSRERQGDRCLT